MMAECSHQELASKVMVPFNRVLGRDNSIKEDMVHEGQLGVVHTIYEDYIDELLCRETSSEGSCCSYTDLFDDVNDYEITNVSINLAFSELPPYHPSQYYNLQSSILAWCDATGLPTTVSVHVAGKVYKLHKFPMVSLSGYMKRELMEVDEVHLDKGGWWPGGAESFEVAASFCYGGRVALSPANVAAVRCAAEVFEMTEEYSRGNLARRCDIYLRQVALRRWNHALLVLQQCRSLRPLADSLLIVAQCIDAIATMACGQAANAVEIHRLNDIHTYSFPPSDIMHDIHNCSFSSIDSAKFDIMSTASLNNVCFCSFLLQLADDQLAWIHDLAELPHYHFSQIVTAARRLGMREKHIMVTLLQYAEKSLFSYFEVNEDGGLSKKRPAHVTESPATIKINGSEDEIVEKIEAMVALLAAAVSYKQDHEGRDGFPMIRFLFALLKCALACGETANGCRLKLECMIEKRLRHARIRDFMLPCSLIVGGGHCCCNDQKARAGHEYKYEELRRPRDRKEVESMRQIITLFFSRHTAAGKLDDDEGEIIAEAAGPGQHLQCRWAEEGEKVVAALWDEYVAELVVDPELTVRKFVELAEVVPPSARPSHDRLYAAIDSFLQSHPSVSQQERQAVCKTLNCQKLSPECCIQAVQNETMPLRIIVQAMFMHQLNATSAAPPRNSATTPGSAAPFLRRSSSCHQHQQQGTTPSTDKKKKTQQLGNLLKVSVGGNKVIAAQPSINDVQILHTRLLTLEEEIQQIKQGLPGFMLPTTLPQHPLTLPCVSARHRAQAGWRRRFTCLGLLRHEASPAPVAPQSNLARQRHHSLTPSAPPACCLPPVSSPVSASTVSRHYHSL